MRRRLGVWAALATALAASGIPGCGFIPRTAVVPMPARLHKGACSAAARTLIVFLPGRGMTMRELEDEGFVDAVRSAGLAVDVLLADAHVGYYKDRSILDRLRADVLAPAASQGYTSIWLAGISLGGLGALLYADTHPQEVAGILAIAPYLGDPDAAQPIADAGGLMRWHAPAGPLTELEIGPAAWRSAQDIVRRNGQHAPVLYLGYGVDDSLAPTHRLLAQALPPERVFTAPGGHRWSPWRILWPRMLVAAGLPRC